MSSYYLDNGRVLKIYHNTISSALLEIKALQLFYYVISVVHMKDHEGRSADARETVSFGMAPAEIALNGVAIIIVFFWCFLWIIHVTSIIYGKWKFHRKVVAPCPESLPAISILKPLTGVDPNLYRNLETFFKMDYPSYELLFCVEHDLDPAIMVVRSLIQKHPAIKATLFIGAHKVGVNPKINNMFLAYQAAKNENILISDSGLLMKPDTLMDMALSMKDGVGLVHQMPFVCDREGFAGALEKVFFGTQAAKMYLNADLLGINCVTGMSCLFRKSVVNEAGGLAKLGHFLAEDYYLGQLFLESGWKLVVSSQPAWQNPGNYSVGNFQARMMRWAKLRVSLMPFTLLLEPLSESLVQGVLASWALHFLFDWSAAAVFTLHCFLWFLLDYLLLHVIQNEAIPLSKLELVACWLFREWTSLLVMLRAHTSSQLTWRNKTYRLFIGARGQEVPRTLPFKEKNALYPLEECSYPPCVIVTS